MKDQVVIYTTRDCAQCQQAKALLAGKGLGYIELNLDVNPSLRDEMIKRTGKRTVPQVFIGNKYVGGKTDLLKLINDASEWRRACDLTREPSYPGSGPGDVSFEDNMEDVDLEDRQRTIPYRPTGSVLGLYVKDDLFDLYNQIQRSRLTRGHCSRNFTSFTGQELVEWLKREKGMGPVDACQVGQCLLSRHFLVPCNLTNHGVPFQTRATYKCLIHAYPNAINAGETSSAKPRPAPELAEEMRRLLLRLYTANLSPDGKRFDYEGLRKSREFEAYVELTRELQRVIVERLTREETLAFFVNLYNALVVHAIVVRGAPNKIIQKFMFFNSSCYIVGGLLFSLQEIQNGILRGNQQGLLPWPPFSRKQFGKGDPRRRLALPRCEPLIHFALVSGCKGCPTIKTYTTQNVEKELRLAAQAYLEDDTKVRVAKNGPMAISSMFRWFRNDFGRREDKLLEFIYVHMGEGEKRSTLGQAMQSHRKLVYQPFDWSSNSV